MAAVMVAAAAAATTTSTTTTTVSVTEDIATTTTITTSTSTTTASSVVTTTNTNSATTLSAIKGKQTSSIVVNDDLDLNMPDIDLSELCEADISIRSINAKAAAVAAAAAAAAATATSKNVSSCSHNCATFRINEHYRNNNNNNNSKINNNSDNNNSCSGCQISAAAASFQLANLIGNSMLLPQLAVYNSSSNKATTNTVVQSKGSTIAAASIVAGATLPKKTNIQFHCEFCTFSCSWKYDLKLHLRQKHGIHNKKI